MATTIEQLEARVKKLEDLFRTQVDASARSPLHTLGTAHYQAAHGDHTHDT